jgi:hypothetical protein
MAMDATEAREMPAAAKANSSLVAQIVPAPFDFRGPTIAKLVREGYVGKPTDVVVTVLNGQGLDPTANPRVAAPRRLLRPQHDDDGHLRRGHPALAG